MIEWMQKHKKWLVVTIWIATIAFIGAGGFAWGVYDYSLSGDSVAKVGKITISKAEYMMRYQEEFDERKGNCGAAPPPPPGPERHFSCAGLLRQ